MENQVSDQSITIEGYTTEQIAFTLKELRIGAAADTIQYLLSRKFSLTENEGYDLIAKVQKAAGIEAVEHFDGQEGEFIVKLMEQGLDKETAKIKAKEMMQKLNKAHSNEGATSMAFGLFFLIVGLVITFGMGSNRIMYGAILVGVSMFIRGIIQMTQKLE